MRLVDTAAGLAAIRHAAGLAVTVAIDEMTFLEPVHIGDVLVLQASVNAVGTTSMEVRGPCRGHDPVTGRMRHVNSAYLVYVAVDDEGHPRPVPPLMAETELEHRRQRESTLRREARLVHRQAVKAERAAEVAAADRRGAEPSGATVDLPDRLGIRSRAVVTAWEDGRRPLRRKDHGDQRPCRRARPARDGLRRRRPLPSRMARRTGGRRHRPAPAHRADPAREPAPPRGHARRRRRRRARARRLARASQRHRLHAGPRADAGLHGRAGRRRPRRDAERRRARRAATRRRSNPSIPVDLVIDHSVQVDLFRTPEAYERNIEFEYRRNAERYSLLRWAQQAFDGLRVVPPGAGHLPSGEPRAPRPGRDRARRRGVPRHARRHRLAHDDDQRARRAGLGRRRDRGRGGDARPADVPAAAGRDRRADASAPCRRGRPRPTSC